MSTFGFLGVMVLGLLVYGLFIGLISEPNEEFFEDSSRSIHSSGVRSLSTGTMGGLLIGLPLGLSGGFVYGALWGVLWGVIFGTVGGVFVGWLFGGKAYLYHYLIRFVLWRSGVVPWRYAHFLEEACKNILLLRVSDVFGGKSYRFLHPLFQEYFASLGPFGKVSSLEDQELAQLLAETINAGWRKSHIKDQIYHAMGDEQIARLADIWHQAFELRNKDKKGEVRKSGN